MSVHIVNRTHAYGVTVQLRVWECPSCGIVYGIPDDFAAHCRQSGQRYYCPNGHSLGWEESDTDRLKKAQAREVSLRDQLQASEAEAEATRRRLIRDRHRFANGVCPCCNRSFENVARHVATKHPEYDPAHLHSAMYACSCGREFASPRGLSIHQAKMRWGTHRTVV